MEKESLRLRIDNILDKLMYYSNPYEPDYITGTVGAIFGTLEEFLKSLDNPQENKDFVELNAKGIIREVQNIKIEETDEIISLVHDIVDYFKEEDYNES